MTAKASRHYYVLAETSQGLANLPIHVSKYYSFKHFPSKLEAIKGSHHTKIYPSADETDFGQWLKESQGEEFAKEWEDYIQTYEKGYQEAIRALESGALEEKIPIQTIEIESPVETYYVRIIAAGYWPEIKEKLCQFLQENEEIEDEDVEKTDYTNLNEEALAERLESFVEERNLNADP